MHRILIATGVSDSERAGEQASGPIRAQREETENVRSPGSSSLAELNGGRAPERAISADDPLRIHSKAAVGAVDSDVWWPLAAVSYCGGRERIGRPRDTKPRIICLIAVAAPARPNCLACLVQFVVVAVATSVMSPVAQLANPDSVGCCRILRIAGNVCVSRGHR